MSGNAHAVRVHPPAVILGGFYPTFSVARSLGERGIPIDILGESANSLPARSRFVRSFLATPDRAEERWLDWLESGPRGAVVIPCGDSGLEFAAHHRAWLEDNGYRPVEANDQIVLAMLDKGQTYDLARAIGIPVPRTAKVKTRVDLDAVADDFEYPCALKPRDSFRFSAIFARKAFVVHSRAELNEAFDLILPTGLEMLVTEIVRGLPSELYEFPSYYTYLDDGGEPLFHFTKRKLREQPLGWGTGTYHVTKWDPEVAELGLRFLQGVGLRGIGNVEFKRDARDGTLKLIECNPRPTATDKLLRHVGLDLGWIAYRRALGEPVERPGPFKDGVHQWTPSRDLVALREGRKLGTLTTASWLASLAHVQHFSIFDLGDPGPNIALTKQSATRIFSGKLTRRRA